MIKYVFYFAINIMFAVFLVFKGYTPNFTLQEDDIRAIQALYGTRLLYI